MCLSLELAMSIFMIEWGYNGGGTAFLLVDRFELLGILKVYANFRVVLEEFAENQHNFPLVIILGRNTLGYHVHRRRKMFFCPC